MIVLALLACQDLTLIPWHLDAPVAVAILAAGEGPFEVPTAYVANQRSGVLTPLDVKTGRLLTDDLSASFLRAAAVPTGRTRLLQDVAVFATEDTIMLWTVDSANEVVLQAPYIIGREEDGSPREVEPVVSEPAFVDADLSGDAASMSEVFVRPGWTTTESWTISFGDGRWWAYGSRSGKQEREPVLGEPYWSDLREVEFTMDGTASEGDFFTFSTETQIDEFDVGAIPTTLLAVGEDLWVGTADGRVLNLDPETGGLRGEVILAVGEGKAEVDRPPQAWRMAVGGDVLYVADASYPLLHRIDLTTLVDTPLSVAAPLLDVAWQAGEGPDGTSFERVFVAPLGASRVDIWDVLTQAWVDPNPVTPEVEGVFIGSPVTGLGASAGPVRMQQPTAWGAWPEVPTVLVATGDGFLFQVDASTGCLLVTAEGPGGPNELYGSTSDYATLDDQGEDSDSSLWIDGYSGEQVVAARCGGVTRSESWVVTYESASLTWAVEGSLSGVQAGRAVEDVRYVSDTGAVSFLIAAGTRPATDGDRFTFSMSAGLLVHSGTDTDGDGQADPPWEFPGRPVGYTLEGGASGGGWDEWVPTPYAILPVPNSDVAARLELETGASSVKWD